MRTSNFRGSNLGFYYNFEFEMELILKELMKKEKEKLKEMADVGEVKNLVIDFLKKTLNVKDVKVIKIAKVDGGWETEGEAYEVSSFIKTLGLPTRVQDRNVYSVKLNDHLKVMSYELQGQTRLTE